MERTGHKGILALIFAALLVLDLWLVVTGRIQPFDDSLLGFFYSIRDSFLTTVFKGITFVGNSNTMIVICILLICLPGRMKVGLPVGLMTAVGWGTQTIYKNIVARQRPDSAYWLIEMGENELYQSFPSGHANCGMILWVALAILIGRLLIMNGNRPAAVLLRIIFVSFAFLIGVSRLYLGVHYPSDVFGGWLLAGVLLIICFALYDRFWPIKWRVALDIPEWDSIPKNAGKKRGWRKPKKRRVPAKMISFPKKRKPWKFPNP